MARVLLCCLALWCAPRGAEAKVFFSQPNAEEVTLLAGEHFGRLFEFVASSDVHARLLAHASSPSVLAKLFGGDAALMAERVAAEAATIDKRLDLQLEDGYNDLLGLPPAEAHARGLLCGVRREDHEDPKTFVAGRCFEGDLELFARLIDVMRGAWRRLRGSEFKGKSAAEKAAAIAAEGDVRRNVLTWGGGPGGGGGGLRNFNAAGKAGAGPPVGSAEADGAYLGVGIEHLADAASAANANASAAALPLPSVSGHGNDTVVRKVLFSDQKEILEYAGSLLMLFTTRASDVTDPWDLHGCRMAHGEAIRWLEYNQHQELADAVRRRGAFQAKVWAMHQETPDCFNRAVHELRPQNRLPYPPRDGTFPHLDYVLEQLEAHGPELFEEYMELNGHDLLNGHVQHEHEQGLQEYFLKDAVWHRTTFWKGALRPCMLGTAEATGAKGGFTKNCAFFKRIEDYWAKTLGHRRQYFVEVKWLVVHPGVWIRPHTADNNQNYKMHYCVQNPGNHYRMIAANSTRVWEPKRAAYLQDSFVHQVRTDAPQGTAPRVVLDIKMIHPDIGNSLAPAIGIFTNLPFRDAKGKPLLANQLLEKLVGLDGDSGRTAQSAYTRWLKREAARRGPGFPDAWHLDHCDDLDLDHPEFEISPTMETLDSYHLSSPRRKKECLRRLLGHLHAHGWDWYGDVSNQRQFQRYLDTDDLDDLPPNVYIGNTMDMEGQQFSQQRVTLSCAADADCDAGWFCAEAGEAGEQPKRRLCLPCGLADETIRQRTSGASGALVDVPGWAAAAAGGAGHARPARCGGVHAPQNAHHAEEADACLSTQGVLASTGEGMGVPGKEAYNFAAVVRRMCSRVCRHAAGGAARLGSAAAAAAVAAAVAAAPGARHALLVSVFGGSSTLGARHEGARFVITRQLLRVAAQLSRPGCGACAGVSAAGGEEPAGAEPVPVGLCAELLADSGGSYRYSTEDYTGGLHGNANRGSGSGSGGAEDLDTQASDGELGGEKEEREDDEEDADGGGDELREEL